MAVGLSKRAPIVTQDQRHLDDGAAALVDLIANAGQMQPSILMKSGQRNFVRTCTH